MEICPNESKLAEYSLSIMEYSVLLGSGFRPSHGYQFFSPAASHRALLLRQDHLGGRKTSIDRVYLTGAVYLFLNCMSEGQYVFLTSALL